MTYFNMNRRRLLAGAAASAAALSLPVSARAQSPASPAPIGLGTWLTFDESSDSGIENCTSILERFLELGGNMVDSSPMYGEAEAVIGKARSVIAGDEPGLYTATKIWTPIGLQTESQMRDSERLWQTQRPFDLVHVHNLLSWETHLPKLQQWKAEGRIRNVGVTTSHGRRHDDLAKVLAAQDLDAVQLTYNILDREAERRLIPLAVERGLMIIANRPFRTGGLFRQFQRQPLPGFAAELGIETWSQYFLKFIISHPANIIAIPATSQLAHLEENMAALNGELPDQATRQRMIDYVESL